MNEQPTNVPPDDPTNTPANAPANAPVDDTVKASVDVSVNAPGDVSVNGPVDDPVDGYVVDPRTGSRPTDPFAQPLALVVANQAAHRATGPTSTPAAPAADDPDAEDAEVFDGEMVDDADDPAELVDPAATPAGRVVVLRRAGEVTRRGTVRAYTATRTAVTHPYTVRSSRALVRNLWYPAAGVGVVAKRWRDAHGSARYERMMANAELAGNHEALLEWEARDVAEKQRRHERLMDWLRSPIDWLKATAVTIAAGAGLLLVLGIILAIAREDIGQVLGPITGVIEAIAFLFWFFSVYGALMLSLATAVGAVFLWNVGRSHEPATPRWLQSDTQRADEHGALLTADGIVSALRHLPIPALKTAFKQGWVPRFDLTPTREGQGAFRGFRTIFDLPMGVTPKMIADTGEVFAKNLHRNAVEVWPSDYGREKGGKAGYVNLYVADTGVMDKPTPEYPLLNEGTADVFEGVPMGITQRGDVVNMPVVGSNSVFGGQPGQGKSNAVRVAVIGAALDPLAEIRVHVFAQNGDFDAYQPRLSRYEKGATAEHVASAVEHLQELYDEVGRREGRLADLKAKKLTRAIAEQHRDLRPLVVGFSECHEMFAHSEHGKLAADLAVSVVKRGRKTGVTLVFDTQSARAKAIPSEVVENVGFNGCFSVKTWRSNDGFLGDGSFAAGIRATELRFNVDRGTMVATGASEELFEIVRTFFIKVDDDAGWDQATEIIERAMSQIAPGTPIEGHNQPTDTEVTERDMLADLIAVLPATGRSPAGDVLGALRNLAPDWAPYAEFTVPTFVAALGELGIKVPSTGNKFPLDAATVRNAQAARAGREKAGAGAE